MPVHIFLRQHKERSFFREYLTRLAMAPCGNSLLLCSGFASSEILDYSLKNAISKGCKGGRVNLVGKYGERGFGSFARELMNCHDDVRLFIQKTEQNNWHAKVAMRLNLSDGIIKPVAAIIGSSNLSQAAYKDDILNWNHECDSLIYADNPLLDSYFSNDDRITDAVRANDGLGVMYLKLDETKSQPNEESQLQALYNKIKGSVREINAPKDYDKPRHLIEFRERGKRFVV